MRTPRPHLTTSALARNATLLAAALAVLWPAARPSAADTLAPSRWTIVEIAGKPAQDGETLEFRDGKAAGKAACNRYFAAYTLDASKLSFGPVGATRMHCGALMTAEQALLSALGRVTGVRREADRLILTSAANRTELVLARTD